MRWMWIDRIVGFEAGRRVVAVKVVSFSEDFLHGGGPPVYPATFIIEGMAQAAGILVGHAGGFSHNVLLAKVARAELDRDALPGCVLRFTAQIERLDPSGAATTGTVDLIEPASLAADGPVAAIPLGRIDLFFGRVDPAEDGHDLPARNVVFTQTLRVFLAMSGVPLP